MLGWFSDEIARASRSKRCFASALQDRYSGRILIATVRSRRVSRARYTSPMPPAPTGATTSYGPSLVPDVSPMRCCVIIVRWKDVTHIEPQKRTHAAVKRIWSLEELVGFLDTKAVA